MAPQETLTAGSLFTGYGGLDMAVHAVTGARTAWVSDIDRGACKILDHRYPGVPNLGDVTIVDWSTVPRVDILTAGYPCQPFSKSGRRKGTNDARHLWPHVREAIRHLRPRVTVMENVAAHRSMGFDRVLGDLAEDGLGVSWTSIRACDVGAPHERERLFIVATTPDADGNPERLDARGARPETGGERRAGVADDSVAGPGAAGRVSLGASTHGRCGMTSSVTIAGVDLDAHTFDLTRLDIEIRCDIIMVEPPSRDMDECTNMAKWVAIIKPHCAGTNALTMMLCQEHLDFLMTGEMMTWCRSCRRADVPLLPYVVRIEPL